MSRFNVEPFYPKVNFNTAAARLALETDDELTTAFGPWHFRHEDGLTEVAFRPNEPEFEDRAERIRAVLTRDLQTVYNGYRLDDEDPFAHLYGRGFDTETRLPIFYVLYDSEVADADEAWDDEHRNDDDDERDDDRDRYDSHTNCNPAARLRQLRICEEAPPETRPIARRARTINLDTAAMIYDVPATTGYARGGTTANITATANHWNAVYAELGVTVPDDPDDGYDGPDMP